MLFSVYIMVATRVAAVAYLVCEDVVLDRLVLFFILVLLVGRSFRGCRLWCLHVWVLEVDISFVPLDEGIIGKFFCIYVEVLIQNVGVRASLISRSICRTMGISEHFYKCTT